jgi:hypothetical protein
VSVSPERIKVRLTAGRKRIVSYRIVTLILRRNFAGAGVLSKPWVNMKGPMFGASLWLLYSCE